MSPSFSRDRGRRLRRVHLCIPDASRPQHRRHPQPFPHHHPHPVPLRARLLQVPGKHTPRTPEPLPERVLLQAGLPLEARFNVEEQRRERAALGTPFGMQEGEKSEAVLQAEQTIRDEEDLRMPRQHEADTKNDFKDLNRRGQRNLYLALLQKEGDKHVWRFPQGPVNQGELLHHAAERDLETQCGDGMDTWIVSRKPVGVYHPPSPPATDPAKKNVVFFYKAHIMAGQVQHDPKTTLDFAWLTKGELSERVEPTYWESVKDMLSDF